MRLIDADVLIEILRTAIRNTKGVAKFIGAEDDPELKMEIKAYTDILNGVKEQPTIEPEPHWIPCSERLPDEDYVLISKKPTKISGSKWYVTIAIRMADPRSGKDNWRDTGFGVIPDDNVLAWMPLPEPYQGMREGRENEVREGIIPGI